MAYFDSTGKGARGRNGCAHSRGGREERHRLIKSLRSRLTGLQCLAVLVFSVGLAQASSSQDPNLEAQVTGYWNAIKSFDLATAYRLEEGARSGTLSPLEFRKEWSHTDWELVDFRLQDIEADAKSAEVTMDLTFAVPQLPKNLHRKIADHWTMRSGEWLRVSKPPKSEQGTAANPR